MRDLHKSDGMTMSELAAEQKERCMVIHTGYLQWPDYRLEKIEQAMLEGIEIGRLQAARKTAVTAEQIEAVHPVAVWLDEAAQDIEGWGAYVSVYLQRKHDLAACVQRYRDRTALVRAILPPASKEPR